ncbi:MAG: MBL fold metallo-hydrolase [Waddliaceae bacterium]
MNSVNCGVITRNLYTVANNLNRDLGRVKIHTDGDEKIKALIDGHVNCLNSLGREFFVKENGEVTELFIAVHRYNQCVQNIDKKKTYLLAGRVHLMTITNQNVPELLPITAIVKDKMKVIKGDQPEIVKERRFFHIHNIRRYPGDEIDHSKEAASIFISTQIERLLSFVGRIIEAIGRIFGCKIERFQKFHYRNKCETDNQIYSKASPMVFTQNPEPTSYWLGHASLLLNLPLRSTTGNTASFNVITDPVEGDLNKLLYPRQTNFARPMESLPASHVYLLSHNHLDHFDKAAIRKLVSQQPIMVVPKGDGYRYTDVGFHNVIELDWWEKQTIELNHDNETYEMRICATPARHWAGQGPCGGHESTFLGYVIEGVEGGDVYFAGDTARLSDDHIKKLRDNFNIKWSFQPGGPDEVRKDMESTHQASVDALWMHFNLMVKKVYTEDMNKKDFLDAASNLKTIYMHTMTFKLGNLHLSDTKDSVERVFSALENDGAVEELKLKVYERQVFDELVNIAKSFKFSNEEELSLKEIAEILRDTVAVPKIGSRVGLQSEFIQSDLFGENAV